VFIFICAFKNYKKGFAANFDAALHAQHSYAWMRPTGWEERLRNDLFCVQLDVELNQSINLLHVYCTGHDHNSSPGTESKGHRSWVSVMWLV